MHLLDSEPTRDGERGRAAVAGDHDHVNSGGTKRFERLGGAGLDRIRHGKEPGEGSVHRHEQDRLSLGAERRGLRSQRGPVGPLLV